jgi:hypothetical protein
MCSPGSICHRLRYLGIFIASRHKFYPAQSHARLPQRPRASSLSPRQPRVNCSTFCQHRSHSNLCSKLSLLSQVCDSSPRGRGAELPRTDLLVVHSCGTTETASIIISQLHSV